MFFCGKRIEYLALYENGEKKGAAGFVRMQTEGECVRFSLQVKTERFLSGKLPFYLVISGKRMLWTALELVEGIGKYERLFACCNGGFLVNGKRILVEEIENVYIEISDEVFIGTGQEWRKQREYVQKADIEKCCQEKIVTEKVNEKMHSAEESAPLKMDEKKDEFIMSVHPDKWEQLKMQFEKVHPFGDERIFINIVLSDFIILREEYQKLVHNSFLLHGFYNYRHLILGKDCRIGNEREKSFYLGVPGVFYEREKMVAVMFGFEGFECDGPVEIGKFGYYLRKVEI